MAIRAYFSSATADSTVHRATDRISGCLKQCTFGVRYGILRARMAISRTPPVVVACTHRTSSTAVYRSLRLAGGRCVVKCHRLCPALMSFAAPDPAVGIGGLLRNRMTGDFAVLHAITTPRQRADFVIMVRDPVAVAASMAAFPVAREWCTSSAGLDASFPLCAPMSCGMTEWFDHDVTPALGWSPWGQPFDHARKALVAQHGPWRFLVMRADLDDAGKERELTDFVGTAIQLRRLNSADERGHAATHTEVKLRIRALAPQVDALYDTRFARHFFAADELAVMRKRWLG